MTRRIEAGPVLVGLGALLLLVSVFLDWYDPNVTAWEAFEVLDLLMVVLSLAAIVAVVGTFAPSAAVIDRRSLPLIVAALAVIVASQILDPPPGVTGDPTTGAWLALGAVARHGGGRGADRRPRVVRADRRGPRHPPPRLGGRRPHRPDDHRGPRRPALSHVRRREQHAPSSSRASSGSIPARLEVEGTWNGVSRLRARATLVIEVDGRRRRLRALAGDGGTPEQWSAAFGWDGDDIPRLEGAELEVGRGIVVDLPRPRSSKARAQLPKEPIPATTRDDKDAGPGRAEAERIIAALDSARAEAEEARETLTRVRAERDELRAGSADLDDLRARAEEAEALRARAEEADGLRSEVEALRARAGDADGLRAEVEELRARAAEADELRPRAEEADSLKAEREDLLRRAEDADELRSEQEGLRSEYQDLLDERDSLREEAQILRAAAEATGRRSGRRSAAGRAGERRARADRAAGAAGLDLAAARGEHAGDVAAHRARRRAAAAPRPPAPPRRADREARPRARAGRQPRRQGQRLGRLDHRRARRGSGLEERRAPRQPRPPRWPRHRRPPGAPRCGPLRAAAASRPRGCSASPRSCLLAFLLVTLILIARSIL